jgi:hypothetical protein
MVVFEFGDRLEPFGADLVWVQHIYMRMRGTITIWTYKLFSFAKRYLSRFTVE